MFADDAKVYQTIDKSNILESDIDRSSALGKKWELQFNVEKV